MLLAQARASCCWGLLASYSHRIPRSLFGLPGVQQHCTVLLGLPGALQLCARLLGQIRASRDIWSFTLQCGPGASCISELSFLFQPPCAHTHACMHPLFLVSLSLYHTTSPSKPMCSLLGPPQSPEKPVFLTWDVLCFLPNDLHVWSYDGNWDCP